MDDLFASFDPVSATHEQLVALVFSLAQRFPSLEQENLRLREENTTLKAENKQLREELGKPGGPPSWVKANVARALTQAADTQAETQKKERKKRSQSFTRTRDVPTEVIEHFLSECPECHRGLSGGWEHGRHQVIEVPQSPVRIIEHVVIARYCGVCHERRLPKLDLSKDVVGKHRFGIGLMSLIGVLRSSCRLPIRHIRSLLATLYGLHISHGEIIATLDVIASKGKGAVKALLEQVRGSPYVHADETGWRENGQNGYLWVFSTPQVRYFQYDQSRAGSVPQEVFGHAFSGVVVSDFYGGYNGVSGTNQRCWVHLLRDAHKLREKYPQNASVQTWFVQLWEIYQEAIAYQKSCGLPDPATPHALVAGDNVYKRRDKRRQFESRLSWLAEPYLERKTAAEKEAYTQAVLCQRLERHDAELFVFIEHPAVPSDNNAAERAIRPSVIARKISGGTRSKKGSKTQASLMSLFGTWHLQGFDLWQQCQNMLRQKQAVCAKE